MPNTLPPYLPVHSLSVNNSPTRSDYFVGLKSGATGDVGLINIDQFINTFLQETIDSAVIDQSTIDLYTAMGWTAPT